MEYAFEFKGHGVFTPDGRAEIKDVEAHNREVEQAEIAWLKTGPEKVFLYVRESLKTPASWDITPGTDDAMRPAITTWLGTRVSEDLWIGPRRRVGFGFHTYRRAINCRIFGTRYVGWYMESSGQYCRLRRARVQA